MMNLPSLPFTAPEEGCSNKPIPTKFWWSTQKYRDKREGSQIKYLSLPRKINSEVDVISRTESPTTSELVEFYEQPNDLLTVRLIKPTNTAVSDHPRVRERHQAKTAAEEGRQIQTSKTTHGHIDVPSRKRRVGRKRQPRKCEIKTCGFVYLGYSCFAQN